MASAPDERSVISQSQAAVPIQPSVQPARSAAILSPSMAKIFAVWAVLFLVFLTILYSIGFAPTGILESGDAIKKFFVPAGSQSFGVSVSHAEPQNLPVDRAVDRAGAVLANLAESRIVIPAIGVDAPIVIPASRDLNVLNDALLKGAVYYPGSGPLGAIGNVLIFGHSTGLSIVRNQNFEVFNRLKELEAGDIIRIRAEDREYWYRVRSLSVKDARETEVLMSTTESVLTLVTCKIFGGNGKESRYVVEAEFVRSYLLVI